MVDIESVESVEDEIVLKNLIEKYFSATHSLRAKKILDNWELSLPLFAKVMPIDYRLSLERIHIAEDTDNESLSATEEVFLPSYMEHKRQDSPKRPVEERIRDYKEIEQLLSVPEVETQASRCRDCGIPYCHSFGCPVNNRIPDFNLMVTGGSWRNALEILHLCNNFPEITGRVCPALCEAACTLSINMPAVSIRHIELQIVERGWENGWITPKPPLTQTGKKVAVIGSGPAGLTAAQQLARKGHTVTVFEKSDRIGGMLRYGIPDFKLEKHVLDRRLDQMRAEGVIFEVNVNAGVDLSAGYLQRTFDAIIIAAGSRTPRDLNIFGRDLYGIHFAMDFLTQQNKEKCREKNRTAVREFPLRGKMCWSSAAVTPVPIVWEQADVREPARFIRSRFCQNHRRNAPPIIHGRSGPLLCVHLLPRRRAANESGVLKHLSSTGTNGKVSSARLIKVDWSRENGNMVPREVPGSEFEIKTDLVLLAAGFLHVEHGPLVKEPQSLNRR